MWPTIELFFGEKLFWFLTQVARSCAVLFVYFGEWSPYVNQAVLKLFSYLSLPPVRICAAGCCQKYSLVLGLHSQGTLPSCPGGLELVGKGVC